MATIDTRPDVVDLLHYAGDTLTIAVTAPTDLVAGLVWSAQVRDTREDSNIAAEFEITEPTEPDGPAFLTLPAAVTRALAETGNGAARLLPSGRSVQVLRFLGEWDVQVAAPGGTDPVTTFAQGSLTIDLDVTREETP